MSHGYMKNKLEGKCQRCGMPSNGYAYCDECRQIINQKSKERSKIRYHERKEKGLCPYCGEPADSGVICISCKEKREEYKQYYSKNGICPICRKNKLMGDEKRCVECKAINANRAAQFRQEHKGYSRKYERERRIKSKNEGKCRYCDRPVSEKSKIYCEMHRIHVNDRDRERRRLKQLNEGIWPRDMRTENGICFNCGKQLDSDTKLCKACTTRMLEIRQGCNDNKEHYWRKDNKIIYGV